MVKLIDAEIVVEFISANDRGSKVERRVAKIADSYYSPKEKWSEIIDCLRSAFVEGTVGRISSDLYGFMPEALRTLMGCVDWSKVAEVYVGRLGIDIPESKIPSYREFPTETDIVGRLSFALGDYTRSLLRKNPDLDVETLEEKLRGLFTGSVYGALKNSGYRNSWNLVMALRDIVDWRSVAEASFRSGKEGTSDPARRRRQ